MTFPRYNSLKKLLKTGLLAYGKSVRTVCISSFRHVSVKELSNKRIDYRSAARGDVPYFVLIIPAAAFCLGCWQVQRREWKINLIKEMDSKTKAAPTDLPADLNDLEHMEYHNIKVRGVFEHDEEMYISPRMELGLQESGDRGGLVSGSSGIGAHVLTPLTVTEGIHKGIRIVINRGWVSLKMMLPETRQQGQVEGEVDVVGVVRHTDKGGFTGDSPKDSRVWQSRDLYAISEKLNTLPIFLDANVATSVKGGPIGGQTRVNLRNEHMSYIVTWYSLAVLTTAVWWFKFKRPLKL